MIHIQLAALRPVFLFVLKIPAGQGGIPYLVYQQLAPKVKPSQLKLLHGMMIPLHKRVEIEKIKHFQAENKGEPQYVVSTQIIEAGVALSFDHIMRALPILPSLIQAAGRVRHEDQIQIIDSKIKAL